MNGNVLASIALTHVDNPNRFGNVKIDQQNYLTSFTEKRRQVKINAGIYFFNKKFLKILKTINFQLNINYTKFTKIKIN